MLTDKTFKDYTYPSRYSSVPYYYNTIDKKYIYGITAQLDDTTFYRTHIVENGDTFDTLALKYYNNPTYYWVICDFNHIQNPYQELSVGKSIKIPALANIKYDFEGRF